MSAKYIIYRIVCDDQEYIGFTSAKHGNVEFALRERIAKHYYRATTENLNWPLYQVLKFVKTKYHINHSVVKVFDNRQDALSYEKHLIKTLNPSLNTVV